MVVQPAAAADEPRGKQPRDQAARARLAAERQRRWAAFLGQ